MTVQDLQRPEQLARSPDSFKVGASAIAVQVRPGGVVRADQAMEEVGCEVPRAGSPARPVQPCPHGVRSTPRAWQASRIPSRMCQTTYQVGRARVPPWPVPVPLCSTDGWQGCRCWSQQFNDKSATPAQHRSQELPTPLNTVFRAGCDEGSGVYRRRTSAPRNGPRLTEPGLRGRSRTN